MRAKTTTLIVTFMTMLVIMVTGAMALDFYVATTGDDTSGGGSQENPWRTIRYALAKTAKYRDRAHTVHIAAGTYRPSTEDLFPLYMHDKVTLLGEDRDATVLNGESEAENVIYADEQDEFSLEDLTIMGGNADATRPCGGGIHCRDSSGSITNCLICGNTASNTGGGIYCVNGGVAVMGCEISDNTASDFGGGFASINLVSFEAHSVGLAIEVAWQTGAEVDCASFALFREVAGSGEYELISGLIEPKGTASTGASYSFADWGVERGVTYNYWLVDIDMGGNWAAHGPATARLND